MVKLGCGPQICNRALFALKCYGFQFEIFLAQRWIELPHDPQFRHESCLMGERVMSAFLDLLYTNKVGLHTNLLQ